MPLETRESPFKALQQLLSQPTVTSFIAGGVAGAISRTVVSPLERMKIIFQIQSVGRTGPTYVGIAPTLLKMWKEEGWRGFMRGNGTNCIRIVPYSAVQFGSYTLYKKILFSNTDFAPSNSQKSSLDNTNSCFTSKFNGNTLRRLTAGGLAGITSVFVTYPLDIVRTRLSIQTASIGLNLTTHKKPLGIWPVMIKIYKTEGGIKALYRGIIPTTLGVTPYVGLNFAIYELVRDLVTPKNQLDPSAAGKLFAGAVSGAVAQTITYPFDVLRRYFQIISMPNSTMAHMQTQYSSVWKATITILRHEGVSGMYKGLGANLLKVAPSMASSWYSYEYVKDFLNR